MKGKRGRWESNPQPLEQAYTWTLESLDRPEEDFLSRSYEALAPPQCQRRYSRSTIIVLFVFFLALGLIGLVIVKLMDTRGFMDSGQSYPKLSPFAAVRWQDDRPEVQIDGQWYELLQIDDVSADEIVRYCHFRYLALSRKRFEEDLVEGLTRMGHPPDDASSLTVKELPDGPTVVLENVEWTREKRNAIKRRNDGRRDDGQTNRRISRDDPRFVRAVDEFISAARKTQLRLTNTLIWLSKCRCDRRRELITNTPTSGTKFCQPLSRRSPIAPLRTTWRKRSFSRWTWITRASLGFPCPLQSKWLPMGWS